MVDAGGAIAVLVPCYDDFDCIEYLAAELSGLAASLSGLEVDLYVINDSPWIEPPSSLLERGPCFGNLTLQVLALSANVGHQKALAAGLSWLQSRLDRYAYVISMDADGEDDPAAIPRMIQALRHPAAAPALACVARRGLRREGIPFRLSYRLYKQISASLAGVVIDYGNFICFRPEALRVLTRFPAATLHLAAALHQSRLPLCSLLVDRRERYHGVSRMGGTTNLVLHAFRAFSVLGDRIAVRLLLFNAAILLFFVALSLLAIVLRFSGLIPFLVFPGWTSLLMIQLLGLSLVLTLSIFSLALSLVTFRSGRQDTPRDVCERYLLSTR